MFAIRHKNLILSIIVILMVASVFVIGYFGLKQGIDFTGGAYLEISYRSEEVRPSAIEAEKSLSSLNLGSIIVQPVGDSSLAIRTRPLTEVEHSELLIALNILPLNEDIKEEQYSSIGPSIGAELKQKAGLGILLVILAVIIYVAIVFRKGSKVVPGWLYGVITIITLLHDILIPTAVFAVLGYYMNVEIDALFVTALLAIMGYSINDTIIVFDRTRENLQKASEKEQKENFAEIVGKSLNETIGRSIFTSLTTLIVLASLLIIGSGSTFWFALTLTIGIVAGAYSSILVASPLLVVLQSSYKGSK
ncbi:MAG: protein translocase subunit SecF [Candidatus Vogelbacteria bacterium CG10_big_fil_rev_8_21_14_0_10_45_14]|uniref:Protein-export membrane protein SecF n=1 Tax=Candidatus Vogelbacteria bacterium CG10_big_fil_rev_8_21_14_0_10_45_14 TaxID=1975042 RepID=A0A2H0RLL8_9BACT|nr:MAG: protein translocase subunit SecF [Candidatus Vogelbacteria bacterium CG10_big_fil_rev_8_21_14_0_10_45_14]